MLAGQGPDELYGGYRRHLGVRYGALWRALPNVLRQPLVALLAGVRRNETFRCGLASLDAATRVERYVRVFSCLLAR